MKRLGFDVLVVGAGPAGLAAAASAARGGARGGLVDDNPAIGGPIWRGTQSAPAGQASRWLAGVGDERVSVLARTRIIAPLGRGALLAETPAAGRCCWRRPPTSPAKARRSC